MTTPRFPTLIDYYEAIERATADMLAAARASNWDEVVRLEGACAVLIAALRQAAETQPLAAAEQQRKSRILQRIVRADAQIRSLCDPLAELAAEEGAPRVLH